MYVRSKHAKPAASINNIQNGPDKYDQQQFKMSNQEYDEEKQEVVDQNLNDFATHDQGLTHENQAQEGYNRVVSKSDDYNFYDDDQQHIFQHTEETPLNVANTLEIL